ncbi:MAG: ABC transporter permease, partial [Candidatus Heimdallarchaeota archaeon]
FMPTVFIAALNSGTIANDKKHNALALYMAKPIDRFDYGVGKFISIMMVSSFVTYIPWLLFMVAFTLLAGVSGTEFLQTIWVYFAAFGAAMVVNLFFGSITLLFSSMTSQSILGGILMILIIFLPSVILNSVNMVFQQDWLNYFSVSSLIASSVYVIFGQPSAGALLGEAANFFGFNINGWISLAILLLISILALLLTLRNLYKERISADEKLLY